MRLKQWISLVVCAGVIVWRLKIMSSQTSSFDSMEDSPYRVETTPTTSSTDSRLVSEYTTSSDSGVGTAMAYDASESSFDDQSVREFASSEERVPEPVVEPVENLEELAAEEAAERQRVQLWVDNFENEFANFLIPDPAWPMSPSDEDVEQTLIGRWRLMIDPTGETGRHLVEPEAEPRNKYRL